MKQKTNKNQQVSYKMLLYETKTGVKTKHLYVNDEKSTLFIINIFIKYLNLSLK